LGTLVAKFFSIAAPCGGSRKATIFFDDDDWERLRRQLDDNVRTHKTLVYAGVLMDTDSPLPSSESNEESPVRTASDTIASKAERGILVAA